MNQALPTLNEHRTAQGKPSLEEWRRQRTPTSEQRGEAQGSGHRAAGMAKTEQVGPLARGGEAVDRAARANAIAKPDLNSWRDKRERQVEKLAERVAVVEPPRQLLMRV